MAKIKTWQLSGATLVLLALGFYLLVHGGELVSVGQVQQSMSSTATFGDVLGFAPDASTYDERDEGAANISDGHLLQVLGGISWALAAGLVLIAVVRTRRPRQPATAVGPPAAHTPVTSPTASAAPAPVAGDVPRHPCPSCGESISTFAKVCRFCGTDLTGPATTS